MPNWCFNSIVTEPKVLDYMKREDENGEVVYDFNKVIAQPEDLGENWYNWNVANWGTKWNCSYPNRLEDNVLDFETAWSPPMPIYFDLSSIFPDIEIEVFIREEGMGYCETMTFLNGDIISEVDHTWATDCVCPACDDACGDEIDGGIHEGFVEFSCPECDTIFQIYEYDKPKTIIQSKNIVIY